MPETSYVAITWILIERDRDGYTVAIPSYAVSEVSARKDLGRGQLRTIAGVFYDVKESFDEVIKAVEGQRDKPLTM